MEQEFRAVTEAEAGRPEEEQTTPGLEPGLSATAPVGTEFLAQVAPSSVMGSPGLPACIQDANEWFISFQLSITVMSSIIDSVHGLEVKHRSVESLKLFKISFLYSAKKLVKWWRELSLGVQAEFGGPSCCRGPQLMPWIWAEFGWLQSAGLAKAETASGAASSVHVKLHNCLPEKLVLIFFSFLLLFRPKNKSR